MRGRNQCLCAIAAAYRGLVGRGFTITEVDEWAKGRGLYPVPKRGSASQAFSEFEARLAEAKRRGLLPDAESPERLRGAEAAAALSE